MAILDSDLGETFEYSERFLKILCIGEKVKYLKTGFRESRNIRYTL